MPGVDTVSPVEGIELSSVEDPVLGSVKIVKYWRRVI
jgi:hypothetical protein